MGSRRPRTSRSKLHLRKRAEALQSFLRGQHYPHLPRARSGPERGGAWRERARGGASGARPGRRREGLGAWPKARGPAAAAAAAAAGSWEARSRESGAQSGGGGGGGSGDGGGSAAAAAAARARAAAAAAGPGARGGAGEPACGVLEQLQPAVSRGPREPVRPASVRRGGPGSPGGSWGGSPGGLQLGARRRRRGGHTLWAPMKLEGCLKEAVKVW